MVLKIHFNFTLNLLKSTNSIQFNYKFAPILLQIHSNFIPKTVLEILE